MKTLYKKWPRLIHLSRPKFLHLYLTHKSTNASSVLHKELHFIPLGVFSGITSKDDPTPTITPGPREESCLSVRKKPSLFCPFCSYHHPTLPLPHNFHSQKASLNLIILVFHQVERFGWWRIGIWLLIYPLSLSAAKGALQLAAIAWVVSVSLNPTPSILDFFPSCQFVSAPPINFTTLPCCCHFIRNMFHWVCLF